MRVSSDQAECGPWAAKKVGLNWHPESMRAIGLFTAAGKQVAGAVFERCTGTNCFVHLAVDSLPLGAGKTFLWFIFYYPFVQLGCSTLTGIVESTNTKAVKLDLKVGFREVGRVPGGCPDGDLLILSMRREDCRYLQRGIRDGRK